MKMYLWMLPMLFLFAACASAPVTTTESKSNSISSSGITMQNDCDIDQKAFPEKGEEIAVITTNFGVMKARLFDCATPKTVENFKELAKKSFYDGLIFHRVINDFMIQGGDPQGIGIGGKTFNDKPLIDEVSSKVKHLRGALSMAKTNMPNSATSQFFIVQNHEGTPFLDGGYTAFGQVFEGLEVIDVIAKVQTDARDKPLEDVKMMKIEIQQY